MTEQELLGYLRDAAQGASNSAASTVSGPVDLLAWILRKGGVQVGDAPVGGSEWMAQKGLTAQPQNALAGMAGETIGNISPIVAAAKAPQIANALLRAGENAAARPMLNPQTGAIVWHGSPHKFDKFDASKIGTGEGAQAYGHGLYLADAPDVAGKYAKDLAASRRSLTNRGLTGAGGDVDAAIAATQAEIARLKALPNGGGDPQKMMRFVALNEEKLTELAKLKAGQQMSQPNLYKVDLPDEHIAKMLDWDKPLSQQAPEVQSAIESAGFRFPPNATGRQIYDAFEARAVSRAEPELRASVAAAKDASSVLRQAGIPGVRYLDGGSRGTGAGTSNYVIFPQNENLLRILERNGVPIGQ